MELRETPLKIGYMEGNRITQMKEDVQTINSQVFGNVDFSF